ncbi:MAG TPA: hypothetical protein VIF57_20675 [Polyangia bacterium]
MEIVESTPRRLVLRKSGSTIRLFLLGAVGLLLVGCLLVYLTARTTSVRCARGPAGLTCEVTERLLGIIPLTRWRGEHVARAFVGYTGDSSDPSYRVELAIEGGSDTPLSSITASEGQCASFARRFNDFVRSGQGAGELLQLPDWIAVVMMPLLFLASLACFLLAQPYRLEIDRDVARLTIRDGLTRKVSHPLADVDDVRVEEREHDGQTLREVFLLLKGGQRLQLAIEPTQVDLVGDYFPGRAS